MEEGNYLRNPLWIQGIDFRWDSDGTVFTGYSYKNQDQGTYKPFEWELVPPTDNKIDWFTFRLEEFSRRTKGLKLIMKDLEYDKLRELAIASESIEDVLTPANYSQDEIDKIRIILELGDV